MKKFLLSALVVFFSVAAFAQNSNDIMDANSEFDQKALELLMLNKDRVTTDSNNSSNARSTINDAHDYIVHIISSIPLFGGDDEDEDYTGKVDDLKFECDKEIAKCRLTVDYREQEIIRKKMIEYKLQVAGEQPVAIESNKVTLSILQ